MKIKSYLSLLILFLGTTLGFSQAQISGNVTGADGLPIPGATIFVLGTSNGTTSDFNGNFTISVEADQNVQISYLGYLSFRSPWS